MISANQTIKNLGLSQDASEKLKNITSVIKTIPAVSFLEEVAKRAGVKHLGEPMVEYKNTFIKETIVKNENQIKIEKEDKSYLNVGLTYYLVENFNIENLEEKQVVLTYDNNRIHFNKPHVLVSTKIKFGFNKKNQIQSIVVERTQTSNYKTTVKTKEYGKKDVAQMLSASNQQNKEMSL